MSTLLAFSTGRWPGSCISFFTFAKRKLEKGTPELVRSAQPLKAGGIPILARTVPLKLAVGLRWPRRRLMCHRQVIYDPSAAEKVTHDFFFFFAAAK